MSPKPSKTIANPLLLLACIPMMIGWFLTSSTHISRQFVRQTALKREFTIREIKSDILDEI